MRNASYPKGGVRPGLRGSQFTTSNMQMNKPDGQVLPVKMPQAALDTDTPEQLNQFQVPAGKPLDQTVPGSRDDVKTLIEISHALIE